MWLPALYQRLLVSVCFAIKPCDLGVSSKMVESTRPRLLCCHTSLHGLFTPWRDVIFFHKARWEHGLMLCQASHSLFLRNTTRPRPHTSIVLWATCHSDVSFPMSLLTNRNITGDIAQLILQMDIIWIVTYDEVVGISLALGKCYNTILSCCSDKF